MDLKCELAKFGPAASRPAPSLAEAEAYTRGLASSHYENFPVLSLAVPRRLRQPMANVYAYCRWADDLADEAESPAAATGLLDWWRQELDDCFEGPARHPVFVALQPTIDRYGLSKEPFADLLAAFQQDQHKQRYQTFDELRDYCRGSADPVGRIVLSLFECASERRVMLSDSICTGLQLINFWQDVRRDLAIGRVYLPLEDLDRFGVKLDDLIALEPGSGFAALMAYEVDRAQEWLRRGLPLARELPGRLGLMISMFARGGLAICDKIRRIDYRVLDQRPKLGKLDLLKILATAARDRSH